MSVVQGCSGTSIHFSGVFQSDALFKATSQKKKKSEKNMNNKPTTTKRFVEIMKNRKVQSFGSRTSILREKPSPAGRIPKTSTGMSRSRPSGQGSTKLRSSTEQKQSPNNAGHHIRPRLDEQAATFATCGCRNKLYLRKSSKRPWRCFLQCLA